MVLVTFPEIKVTRRKGGTKISNTTAIGYTHRTRQPKRPNKKPRYKERGFSLGASQLYPAKQHQNQQNDQNRTDDPRRPVTPTSRVREDRKTADQQENQDDDQNCADAHDEFLLMFLVNGNAVQAFANFVKSGSA
jgi:hypothetical protein